MVLLIIIPFLNGYFIGNIPYFRQTQMCFSCLGYDHLPNIAEFLYQWLIISVNLVVGNYCECILYIALSEHGVAPN